LLGYWNEFFAASVKLVNSMQEILILVARCYKSRPFILNRL